MLLLALSWTTSRAILVKVWLLPLSPLVSPSTVILSAIRVAYKGLVQVIPNTIKSNVKCVGGTLYIRPDVLIYMWSYKRGMFSGQSNLCLPAPYLFPLAYVLGGFYWPTQPGINLQGPYLSGLSQLLGKFFHSSAQSSSSFSMSDSRLRNWSIAHLSVVNRLSCPLTCWVPSSLCQTWAKSGIFT
jgi:hypothetical protein